VVLSVVPGTASGDRRQSLTQVPQVPGNYRVSGVSTREARTAVSRTGVGIEFVGPDYVLIRGLPGEVEAVRRLGFAVSPIGSVQDFPPEDSKYHNYKEVHKDVAAAVAAHPDILESFSIGKSYEGRDILAAKISDNVAVDENEPEVLFDGLHHAREHLTVEMTLAIMHFFVDGYGKDAAITRLVNRNEIWVVFEVNPDGGQYDIQDDYYHYWRKNRQPNEGSQYIGTDLNRNYDYKWGCCGGSDGDPGSEIYRGAYPFSAPESKALADFVDSRVVGGVQQIKVSISFHTFGELVMWPYGYTYEDVPPDMTQKDHDVFVKMGQYMAQTTCQNNDCYTPQQSSDLYITDGTSVDWLYGVHRIFAYTIEMYGSGFYPGDEIIKAQTKRLKGAVLYLTSHAKCPYQVIGKSC
jgi:carboxypeptidase T